MALTMTRTRTQTALTKLAERLSNVKGEIQYIEELLVAHPEHAPGLLARQRALQSQHKALCITLSQFDEHLDLDQVVAGAGWRKVYRVRSERSLARQYLAAVRSPTRENAFQDSEPTA